MAERGPPLLGLPTTCKHTTNKATEQAKIVDPPQPGPQSQMEVEVVLHPDQVPDLVPPNPQDPPAPDPPAHIPDPVQPQDPPAHVPNQMQPQNPPVHVPNPILPPAPLVQISQLNWSYFKPEFSSKPGRRCQSPSIENK